ncbi:uncharacterized protein [Nothobranchius furzeri]|uniref:Family with sequence similarity 196, member B n=3 Tax=Nothobranchius furzeri TaxID=105023 RepID=A0A1A7Z9X5_NOTFU|nr:putative LOC107386607-like protein [Nothobranchius furzeri]
MGRRAADPATPVPVLGVPASVGGWKTTGGDRGGVPLQTWGQCSVGIQTSPGISRPPAQLPNTPSDNITQTSNSGIAKETEVTSPLTKNNNEKGAILRHKSGETKIKKEVTFKALGGDTSKEGGIYGYATAIRTNPLIAGSVTGSRTKLKNASRYMNGSVVDSEAIGGISVVNDEAEAESDLRLQKTDQSGKTVPLSVGQALAAPQKMCNLCGGRKSTQSKNTHLPEKPSEPGLTSVSTSRQLQVSHMSAKLQQEQLIYQSTTDKEAQIAGNPRMFYLNEELRYRNIPHPACPVHSRGKIMTLSHPHGASDEKSIQPATSPQANATAVAKATKEPLPETQQNTILNWTPQMSKSPLSHPKLLKTAHLRSVHDNIPQDICVSVHATPNNVQSSPAYTVAMRSGTTSCTKNPTFNPEVMPSDCNLNTEQEKQISNQTNATNSLQMAPKCITLTNRVFKSDHPAHHAPAIPPHMLLSSRVSSTPGEGASTDAEIRQAHFLAFTKTPHTAEPHSSDAGSQNTLNHKADPDQITSTKHKSVALQSHSTHPQSSTSEPNINMSASSLHKASHASKPLDSRAELPAAFTVMYPDALHKNVACRNIKVCLEKTAGSLLSPLTEKQNNVTISSTSSLQLASIKKVFGCNEAPDSSRAHHTQAANTRNQESNEPTALDVTPNQESSSRTTSECQSVSENLKKSNKQSTFTPSELLINESKDHEKSIRSRGCNTQNYVSIIKSSSSCLQGCLNTEQQRFTGYQGYTETKDEGRCATSPPVNTDSNTQQFPQGATASHAHSQLKPNADRQTSYISPSVPTQTNCEPIVSNAQMRPITSSPAFQNFNLDIALQKQTHTSPECSVRVPASFSSEGELGANRGLECESTLPSFTMLLVSSPQIRSSEVEANRKLDSKCNPCDSELFSVDRRLAHSHPAKAAPALPSSPQPCRSEALEQRLKAVEASLAANKDRIATLLNIIHDLERVSTPSSHQRCCKTGLDLKNCSTCQKTACVVYSVEYDFRQQERHFLEVLNRSAGGNTSAFSARLTQPLEFRLLKNIVVKNLTKTKLKSKKLCTTLLKWLPRRIQQH